MKIKIALIIFLLLPFVALAKEHNNSTQAPNKPARNLAVNQVNNAVSEKRIALVIGNSAYVNSPLKNPTNDAQDVAKKLRTLGFEVIERNNLTTKQIGRTLSEFRSKLVPGSVALVFYAGHGLQIKGENYLPAVDAEIAAEEDVPTQSIAVRHIMELLDEAKTRLNLVFLDACRNNPYARSFRSASGEGLARISAPSGTLISYATRPGSVAGDGDGRNGLYTSKLLKQMDSNLQIELALKQVVTDVKVASQGKQEPWMEGSIEGDFCFAGCVAGGRAQVANMEPLPAPTHVKSNEEIEDEYWQTIKDSSELAGFEQYLKDYPQGRYVGLAQVRIRKADEMKPGKVFKDCPGCPEMVVIPAGSFDMGANNGRDNEKPVHRVSISRNFAMGKTEITRGQFAAFVNATSYNAGDKCWALTGDKWEESSGKNWRNPGHQQDDSHPAACLNWNDAKAYVEWLSRKTGKPYQLPTESQWEYACRAGGQQTYCGSDNIDSVAWYERKNGDTTHPAAQKQANAFGLYDMSGNVWEWVEDSYHDTYSGAPTEGSAWSGDGAKRVLRGGSWFYYPSDARSAFRGSNPPANRGSLIGFRVARTLP